MTIPGSQKTTFFLEVDSLIEALTAHYATITHPFNVYAH